MNAGTTITKANRAEWLAERRNGIGASEAPAICGVSDYATPLDIYLRKVGLAPEPSESEAMAWGTRLEPVIAQAYAERTGATFTGEQWYCRSPKYPWMFATLDRVVDGCLPVELKTIGARAAAALGDQLGDDGSDVVPLSWRVQVTHQMLAFGADESHIAALIGGQEMRVYTVRLDPRVASRLVDLEDAFWTRVQRHEPPPANPDKDGPLLRLLHPEASGEITLPIETEVEVVAWEVVKAEIARLQKQADRHKAAVLAAMGGAAVGTMSDGRTVTRKIVTRSAYTCPESSYVDVRIKTPRGSQ